MEGATNGGDKVFAGRQAGLLSQPHGGVGKG